MSKDNAGIELRDWIRRDGVFTGQGAIKLDLTSEQVENWYNHLLIEEPVFTKNLSQNDKADILVLNHRGFTEIEISKEMKVSRTMVRDFLINLKFNELLERVHECALILGDRKEPVWKHGEHISNDEDF